MTTTVLGSNGRLGGMLARHAHRAGLGWQTQSRDTRHGLTWSGDFNDAAANAIFHEGSTIINMIGHTGPDEATLMEANVTFVQSLLQRAADRGVAHVILVSSASVYGSGTGVPLKETDPLAPLNAYGASKAAMEDIAHAAPRGPKITILRIGNIAGADALLHVARMKTAEGASMPLHHFADGQAALRSYIGPADLTQAIVTLAAQGGDGDTDVTTLNVAHPSPVRLDDLLVSYRAHLLPDLQWHDVDAPASVPASVVLNVDALQRLYAFPEVPNPSDLFARQVAEDQTS